MKIVLLLLFELGTATEYNIATDRDETDSVLLYNFISHDSTIG